MRLGTVLSLGASALLGLGALFVARVWMPSAQAPQPGAGAPAAVAGVPVVVATTQLAYGVKLEPKHLTVVRFPEGAAPEGAFSSVEALLKGEHPPVVLAPMAAKEPVLPSKISGPGQRPTLAAVIDEGMRAYTIRVTDIAGVGGHALPGDRVDIMLMRDMSPEGERRLLTDVVLQNVRLLGVDLNADPTSATPAVARSATVEVTVEDAQKLAMAADLGTLSLVLRRAGEAETEIMRPLPVTELGVIGTPVARRDAAGPPTAAAAAPIGARRPQGGLIVTHGDNRALVEVPSDRGA